MPFSLGSKIAIKAQTSGGKQSLYRGYTTIEGHEDTSDPLFPLYYVPTEDDFSGIPITFTIKKDDIIDLYVIGEGADGVSAEAGINCDTSRCAGEGDDITCCCAADYGEGTICFPPCGNYQKICCNSGTYATGGYGIPYHIRLDTTSVGNEYFPATLTLINFTPYSSPPGGPQASCSDSDNRDKSIYLLLRSNKDFSSIGSVLVSDAYSGCGADYYENLECTIPGAENSCSNVIPCRPCDIFSGGEGTNSSVTTTANYGLTVTVTSYGSPESDGTVEGILTNNFGWSGVDWNLYGTGGTGDFVYQKYNIDDIPDGCGVVEGGTGAEGRILGIAINPTFEP